MITDRPFYPYRQALARVGRHVDTIRKWRRRGLCMTWDEYGRRLVEHETLMKWGRESREPHLRNRGIKPETAVKAEDLY